ncbi:MAG: hypothetical protein CR990_00630 [Desulfococcus sp.]|nr:MAG: hypothetical protein CR990_00630 [Desulfococcus sp.]
MNIPALIIGGIALVFGRKFFWLFTGVMGFSAGFRVTELFQPGISPVIIAGVGILVGVTCAVIAIFLQKLAIGIAGLICGAYLTLMLLPLLRIPANHPWTWAFCLAGGILGTLLLVLFFDWALIALSALAGASLICQGLMPVLPAGLGFWIFSGLLLLGALVQGNLLMSETSPGGRRRRSALR